MDSRRRLRARESHIISPRQLNPQAYGLGGFFVARTPTTQHTALSILEYALSLRAGGRERFSIAIALQPLGYTISTAFNTHFYSYDKFIYVKATC